MEPKQPRGTKWPGQSCRCGTPRARSRRFGRPYSGGGLAATAVLLVGLLVRPEASLRILWNIAIPILPAVFLINPMIWRNVCPLATVNELTGNRIGARSLDHQAATALGAAGIVLLFLMVPARRFLFNADGLVLAVTIVAVAIIAAAAGLVYAGKAGFCNGICPVLPVERLYGQRPMVDVANARCAPCTLCTERGCLSLTQTKSIPQTLGKSRREGRWLLTPFGLFAAAFPGFIIGYFTAVDGPIGSAAAVYGRVLAWAAVSALVVVAWVRLRPGAHQATIAGLGAVAVGLYYWFASPVIVEALALPEGTAVALRGVALTLVVVWLLRAPATQDPPAPSIGLSAPLV